MSTTFVVKRFGKKIEVAHRHGIGNGKVGITWLSDTTKYSDETKVYPIDNTAQGVETMGDLRRLAETG